MKKLANELLFDEWCTHADSSFTHTPRDSSPIGKMNILATENRRKTTIKKQKEARELLNMPFQPQQQQQKERV